VQKHGAKPGAVFIFLWAKHDISLERINFFQYNIFIKFLKYGEYFIIRGGWRIEYYVTIA
jgi:hypothetical protein